MPRTPKQSIFEHPKYLEYIGGQPDENGQGTKMRWDREVPFDTNENKALIVPLGEVFCRCAQGDTLCSNKAAFSNTANLRVHIRSVHGKQMTIPHKGASSFREIDITVEYYSSHVNFLKGETEEQMAAPSKGLGKRVIKPKYKTYEYDELDFPRYKVSGKGFEKGDPNGKKMRSEAQVGSKGCTFCEEKGTMCPPAEASRECMVWALYINKAEAIMLSDEDAEGESEEGDDDTPPPTDEN